MEPCPTQKDGSGGHIFRVQGKMGKGALKKNHHSTHVCDTFIPIQFEPLERFPVSASRLCLGELLTSHKERYYGTSRGEVSFCARNFSSLVICPCYLSKPNTASPTDPLKSISSGFNILSPTQSYTAAAILPAEEEEGGRTPFRVSVMFLI